jgi:hypothetical protein
MSCQSLVGRNASDHLVGASPCCGRRVLYVLNELGLKVDIRMSAGTRNVSADAAGLDPQLPEAAEEFLRAR